jgi:calcineurin-like phosphoesterase family protein
MKYFISDTHFLHSNIVKLCPKRFKGFEEVILNNLKNQLKEGDELYHLGDFAWFHSEELLNKWLEIPGKKFLVKGNHDARLREKLELYFDEIFEFSTTVEIKGKKVLLCHYPSKDLKTFRFPEFQKAVTEIYFQEECSLLIHGHVHYNVFGIFCGCHLNRVKCQNVNVEFTDFRALSEEELPL